MPIGKNALKRVSNNGYSKVNTEAPDMEDSVIVLEEVVEIPVIELPVEVPVVEEATPAPKKRGRPAKKAEAEPVAEPTPAPKKRGRPAKKAEEEKLQPKKPVARKPKSEPKKEEKVTDDVTHPDGFVKVSCGMDMPAYLL